jgi:hypothetical protein
LFYSGHAAHADCLCSSLTLLQLTMSNHRYDYMSQYRPTSS